MTVEGKLLTGILFSSLGQHILNTILPCLMVETICQNIAAIVLEALVLQPRWAGLLMFTSAKLLFILIE